MYEEDKDTIIGVMPFYHVGGKLYTTISGLFMGATIVVFPKFDFEVFLRAIEKFKVYNYAFIMYC